MTPVLFTRYYMKRAQGLEEILKTFAKDFQKAFSERKRAKIRDAKGPLLKPPPIKK